MRLFAVALLAALLVAGCTAPPRTSDHAPGAQQASTVPGQASGDSATPGPSPGPSQGPGSAASSSPSPATVWFLHTVRDGPPGPASGQPVCNPVVTTMDLNDTPGDCDAHGRTTALAEEGGCQDLCFPAPTDKDAPPAYPAGTPVQAILYVTCDAADTVDVSLQVKAGDAVVASGDSPATTVVGGGGALYTPLVVNVTLTQAVPAGAHLEVDLHAHAAQSYFFGFEGDHASRVRIGA